MLIGAGQAAPNGAAADGAIKDTTTQTFAKDVIEESRNQPVLVDFWAPWCGPCKQLAPVIEKVVAKAGGKVKLVKMNIDEHPGVAGQLGIQSIPAVIAFQNGQPVDGFMGALPESQVQAFIDRIAGPAGPQPADEIVAAGEEALANGDFVLAEQIFAEALGLEPDNVKALAGLARARLEGGAIDDAKAILEQVPADKAKDPAVLAVKAQLDVAEQAAGLGDLAELAAKVEANPKDHQSRYDLAVGLAGKGKREEAMDHLLEIVRRERGWNEEAARKQLVQLFEAWGPTDELTLQGRRRLSSLLFS